ncbi:gliding motility-associated C-terminal domain-containing protein, partial [Lishizhenia sp.]|uniref:T9SS type B sorting domain-containing protein n=1 Tax=Lishizhenia sp. TaxID=2497594 RepID=UPI00299DC3FB
DTAEGLLQKQSQNFGATFRIYLNDLAASNVANQGNINNDTSYVLVGTNLGNLCSNANANNEKPVNITARLEREWRLQNTNFVDNYSVDLTLDNCAILDSSKLKYLRLLVDTDGDFTNAQAFDASAGVDFELNGNVLSVKNLSNAIFPKDSTRFFTVAVEKPQVGLQPFASHICVGDSIAMVFTVSQDTVDVTYSDGTNDYQVPNVYDGYSIMVSPTVTTQYKVIIEKIFACCSYQIDGDTTTLIVKNNPTVTTSNDTTICRNATVAISAAGAGTDSYLYHWSHTQNTDSLQNVSPVSDTLFSVFVQDNYSCVTDTVLINIQLYDSLTANVSSTQDICPGDSALLEAEVFGGLGGDYTFNWSTGFTTVQGNTSELYVSPADTMTYQISINDACETTPIILQTTVNVSPAPLPMFTLTENYLCEPATFHLVNATDTSTNYTLEWTVGGSDVQSDNIEIYTGPWYEGLYDVEMYLITDLGCEQYVNFADTLVVYPLPTANFNFSPQPTTMFNTEIDFTNNSVGESFYYWNFSSGNPTNSNDENPTVLFPDGVVADYPVQLIVETNFGCLDTITKVVSVLSEVIIYAPNSFTPDGDEYNATWKIIADGIDPTTWNLSIYDRWGELVWLSKDITLGWDGAYKGALVPDGVYVWRLEVKDLFTDAYYQYGGHINVLR